MFDFNELLLSHKSSLANFIKQQDNIYLLCEMPGNIGDHFIFAGTEQILEDYGISYNRVLYKDIDTLLNSEIKAGVLVIPGSGAFDSLWQEWEPELVIKTSKFFNKVIILPSSFDIRVPIVKECLKLANVFAFARENVSYHNFRHISKIQLGMDCALYFPFESISPNEKLGTLIAFREDKGSQIDRTIYELNKNNNDISSSCKDLTEWITIISQSSDILTDRLHVAVAAILLNKKLRYFDPYDQKISNYIKYTFANKNLHNVSKVDIDWLINNLIIKVIK